MGVNVVKLGELCEILDSKRKPVTKKDRVAGEYPYYGATGVQDYVADYIFDEKFVLVGEDGAKWGAGENTAYAISGKCWVNNHAHVLRPNRNKVLDNYIIYYLNQLDLRPYITGAIIEKLNQEQLRNILIPLPTIEEQNRIVALMDKADEIRAKKKLANDKLDEFLKSTFISMFGTPIANEKHWEVKKLKELTTKIMSGNTPKGGSQVYVPSGIEFYRSQNVWKNRIEKDDIAYIDEATHKKMERSSLKHNDILITKTGRINTENSSLGRSALYVGEDDKANINGHVYLVRLKEGMCHRFILTILTSNEYREHIRSVCVGGIDKRQLNKEHIEDFPIIYPPIEDQNKFAKIVERVEAQKQKNELVIEQMNNLFNSLSQRAFKGEL